MTVSRKKKVLVAGLLTLLVIAMLTLVVGPKRTARVIARTGLAYPPPSAESRTPPPRSTA